MSLQILAILIFLVTLVLVLSTLLIFVELPLSRRKLRARLTFAQHDRSDADFSPSSAILRESVLREIPVLDRLFFRVPFLKKLETLTAQAGLSITTDTLLLLCLSLASLVLIFCQLIFGSWGVALLAAAAVGTVPILVLLVKRQQRFARFEETFSEAIDLLARAVRAGHAFTTGLELIATEMPDPVAEEFRTVYDQQNLGLPIREALQNLAVRVPLPDVRVFVAALQIQRESGGNLGEILDNLSQVTRDRFKLIRQVQIHTAEGRLSLYILAALPPITAVLLYFSNPEYMLTLFTDPMGKNMLVAAVVLQVTGFLVIRRIVHIKV